ncbi:MAG: hypothetical protein DRP71_04050 [Verrucomicrobia bacterium]|nr:MAG: hypothetical protein DRP71_04050 [Verrucomicrobiota bacterium]
MKPSNTQSYWNPYYAGFLLGLVLLSVFVVMGRGLGASGAFSTAVATSVNAVAPEHAAGNGFYAHYLGDGETSPLKDWLVFEVLGVMVGGFLSAALASRLKLSVERGPRIAVRARLLLALTGGALMGIGSKLALGCTSGQGLSGGALLNVGSWAFMLCVFAGAYALAWFLRRQWI